MKILVIGCGSVGERHIRNLQSLSVDEILAYDIDTERLRLMQEKYNAKILYTLKETFNEKIDGTIICTPPNSHVSLALSATKRGEHVFIEKPLSNNLKNIDKLINELTKKNLVGLVGYCFRFHKGIRLVKQMLEQGRIGKALSVRAEFGQYLPDWRPWQNYRKSYTALKKLGGGIILDGSHEIDYVRWFMGEAKEVFTFAGKISDLEVETEDIAEIFLKFENEAIAEIHLDFVRPGYIRHCEIIGETGVIQWDYTENVVKLYNSRAKKWKNYDIKTNPNDMYIEEIKHFINCIRGKERPLVDVNEGKKVLEISLAAKKSAKIRKMVTI